MIKKILITGASQGIGKALAVECGKRGAKVALLARNEEALKDVESEIGDAGGKAFIAPCDVSEKEDFQESIKNAWDEFGGLDAAVLNAAIGGPNWAYELDSSTYEKVFGINVFGIIYGLETLIPLMRGPGGYIAGVSSLADVRGFPGSGAYSSSKAAASHILEAARVELKDTKVKIATIRPGFVKTNMTDKNDFHMPFLMGAPKAAKIIMRQMDKGMLHIYFPRIMSLAAYLGKITPAPVFEYFAKARNKEYKKR